MRTRRKLCCLDQVVVRPPNVDLSPLSVFVSDWVTNLGVKFDPDLKFEVQIRSVVLKRFYQLRQIAKVKPILSRPDLEKVIHVFNHSSS